MPKHYTGVLEIHSTTHPEPVATDRRINATTLPAQPVRETQEVARIVLRADSLPKLIEKLGQHVALIEEES